jgi:hypothetical protein
MKDLEKAKKYIYAHCINRHEIRPGLLGMLHKDGKITATDANVIVVLKTEYPAELEGLSIMKTGEIQEAAFPKCSVFLAGADDPDLPAIWESDKVETLRGVVKSIPKELQYVCLLESAFMYKGKGSYLPAPNIVWKNALTCLKLFEIIGEKPSLYVQPVSERISHTYFKSESLTIMCLAFHEFINECDESNVYHYDLLY